MYRRSCIYPKNNKFSWLILYLLQVCHFLKMYMCYNNFISYNNLRKYVDG